jgi:hypothetical protein
MTEERLALSQLLEKTGEGDFPRAVARQLLQLLMEADVEGLIGAECYERSGKRTTSHQRTAMSDPRATAKRLLRPVPPASRG